MSHREPFSPATRAFLLNGFDDPALDAGRWADLLRSGDTDVPHLTRVWQRAWWDALAPGQLLLVAGERAGRIVALAAWYSEAGLVEFVGTGDADYLDVLGDIGDPDVLDAMIEVAARAATGFCGFRLFAVPDTSRTGARLVAAAERLGYWGYGKRRSSAPRLDLVAGRDQALACANGPKVAKRERYFSRQGSLELRAFSSADHIDGRLETLFDQHEARWASAGVPSRFADAGHRRFLHEAIRCAGDGLQPRLTWLEWRERPIACEFAWVYHDVYFAVASSFAPDLAARSPGQVLQRMIVLAALQDGLTAYDFGNGDYPYKMRYATAVNHLQTWELFPKAADDGIVPDQSAS